MEKTRQRFLSAIFPFALFFALTFSPPLSAEARNGPASFADMAEKLLPSVVNISTSQNIVVDFGDLPDFPPGSPFEEFFKDFFEKHGKNLGDNTRKRKTTSLGSGFVIDPAGYIVTNYHVVQNADSINVILQDDTNLSAKIVGKDKKTDLAVLKVESPKPLQAVSWGDSDKVRVGDWILAIGNPYGLGGTVTAGIISARARNIQSGPYDDYLQTDAPINRGNSGGPMFNMDGEVIGINTAIFSPSGGSIGIGFAVPSSLAKSVVEQLKTGGHVKRGWIGVRIQTVTPEIADSIGIGKPRGALVSSVTADGPAAKAKIEAGDVIVTFDGKEVVEMRRLPRIVAETPVGKTVPVTVIRKGKEIVLQMTVGELSDKEEAEDEETAEESESSRPPAANVEKISDLGLSVAPINESSRKRYGLDKSSSGAVVVKVDPEGPAAEKGIQPGDVISEASQQEINSPKDLAEAVKQARKDKKPVLLLIDRKGDVRYIAVNLETKKEKKERKGKKVIDFKDLLNDNTK